MAKTFGIIDFAIYIGGAGFVMLVKYPTPQAAINGPIEIFSLNVGYYIFKTLITPIYTWLNTCILESHIFPAQYTHTH